MNLDKLSKKASKRILKKSRRANKNNMISFKYSKYYVREGYQGETVTIKYNDKLLYILSNNDEVLVKYTVSKRKQSRRYRVWYMLSKLKAKVNGFINSEEYFAMPNWIKNLFIHTFKKDTSNFITLLELIETKPKDFVNKCMKKKHVNYTTLTIDILLEYIITV